MNPIKKLIPIAAITACFGPISWAQSSASEDVYVLSPFTVETSEDDSYLLRMSNTGSIVAMDVKDIPMDTTSIGANMIEEMALFNADALGELVPGISSNEAVNTGGGGDNTVYTLRGFRSVPRRAGFAPGGRIFDMTSVERIDVIKGPNSVLYGQSDPGGIINYVPKRPRFQRRSTITASYGSYDSYRVSVDTMGPIGKGKRFAYRLPMAFSNEENEIDFYQSKRRVIAPSVLYRLGKATEFFVETEFLRQETNLADNAAWEVRDANGDWVIDYTKRGLGRSFNERGPNSYAINEQQNIVAEVTTKIGDHLSLRAAYSYNERDTEIRQIDVNNDRARRILSGGVYPAFVSFPYNRVKGYKVDALYEKNFGGVRSRTLVGYERNENIFGVTRYNSRGRLAALPNPLNGGVITEQSYAWTLGDPRENPADWTIVAGHPTSNSTVWHNLRLVETLYLFENRLVVMGGVARSDVRRAVNQVQTTPTEKATTHFAGATFKATDKIVFFANHSTSFAPVFRTGLNDQPLDPTSGVGSEVGVKFDLLNNRLFATLTYFDLKNEGLPLQIPAGDSPTGESYFVNSGEERARGVELSVDWKVNEMLSLNAGVMSFDGELLSASEGASAGAVGQDLPRSPEQSGQISVVFTGLKDSRFKGLRAGLTASYKASTPIRANYTDPTVVSDDYTILSGFIRYRLPVKRDVQVFMNVKNIADKEYITANGFYGELRDVSAGMTLKF